VETLGCTLCGKTLDKRIDKNGKPYFICDHCGTQFFIRRQEGVSRLEALMKKPGRSTRPAEMPGAKRLISQISSLREHAAELTDVCDQLPDASVEWVERFQTRLMRTLEKIEQAFSETGL
jgi:hypothetical protein